MNTDTHKLDTDTQVFFYEQDFYILSNFSSFRVRWRGIDFDTSEHAYHFAKFTDVENHGISDQATDAARELRVSRSAHEAFKIAERNKIHRRADWDEVKIGIMKDILLAKVTQHEYVYRKLLATGDRELIEDSWRDACWGWGADKKGQNLLGKIWMEIREELRKA